MRLDKLLANMSVGTRSEVKELVRKGRVRVNGVVVKDSGASVNETDDISVDGHGKVDGAVLNESHWYMLNKPAGVLSATEDKKERTVTDILAPEGIAGLFPVGRLDKDTEGLLLMTDDGVLGHYLLSPKREVPKAYYARLDTAPCAKAEEKLEQGIEFKEFTSKPAKLKRLTDVEVLVTVTEGKFHEVKRLMAAVGSEVLYLRRVSFGPLQLDESLQPGEYRRLSEEEIAQLNDAVRRQ